MASAHNMREGTAAQSVTHHTVKNVEGLEPRVLEDEMTVPL